MKSRQEPKVERKFIFMIGSVARKLPSPAREALNSDSRFMDSRYTRIVFHKNGSYGQHALSRLAHATCSSKSLAAQHVLQDIKCTPSLKP